MIKEKIKKEIRKNREMILFGIPALLPQDIKQFVSENKKVKLTSDPELIKPSKNRVIYYIKDYYSVEFENIKEKFPALEEFINKEMKYGVFLGNKDKMIEWIEKEIIDHLKDDDIHDLIKIGLSHFPPFFPLPYYTEFWEDILGNKWDKKLKYFEDLGILYWYKYGTKIPWCIVFYSLFMGKKFLGSEFDKVLTNIIELQSNYAQFNSIFWHCRFPGMEEMEEFYRKSLKYNTVRCNFYTPLSYEEKMFRELVKHINKSYIEDVIVFLPNILIPYQNLEELTKKYIRQEEIEEFILNYPYITLELLKCQIFEDKRINKNYFQFILSLLEIFKDKEDYLAISELLHLAIYTDLIMEKHNSVNNEFREKLRDKLDKFDFNILKNEERFVLFVENELWEEYLKKERELEVYDIIKTEWDERAKKYIEEGGIKEYAIYVFHKFLQTFFPEEWFNEFEKLMKEKENIKEGLLVEKEKDISLTEEMIGHYTGEEWEPFDIFFVDAEYTFPDIKEIVINLDKKEIKFSGKIFKLKKGEFSEQDFETLKRGYKKEEISDEEKDKWKKRIQRINKKLIKFGIPLKLKISKKEIIIEKVPFTDIKFIYKNG